MRARAATEAQPASCASARYCASRRWLTAKCDGWKRGMPRRMSRGANWPGSSIASARKPRASGANATSVVPSSWQASSNPSSGLRLQSEYSFCTALTGCTALARRSVAAETSESPIARTCPEATMSAIAPMLSSIGTRLSQRCRYQRSITSVRSRVSDSRQVRLSVSGRPSMTRRPSTPVMPHLVARWTRLRQPASASPSSDSFAPKPYSAAVSKCVMPSSIARCSTRCASRGAGGTPYAWLRHMQPSPISATLAVPIRRVFIEQRNSVVVRSPRCPCVSQQPRAGARAVRAPHSRAGPAARDALGSRPSRMAAKNSRSCSSMPFIETSTFDTSTFSSRPVTRSS